MNYCKYFCLAFFLLLSACKTQNTGSTVDYDSLIKKIVKKLGEDYRQVNNPVNTYVLAWKEDKSSGTMVLRYGVWVIATGELLYAGSAINGKAQWLDNESLLVEDYPGIVDGNQQTFKYKIDLKTKTKIPLNEKEDI